MNKTKSFGPKNSQWKGGVIKNNYGYLMQLKHGHPSANRYGYVRQHRLIMESILGRYLLRTETVHHKNGVRYDNRPENLELRVGSHGQGARYEDLIQEIRAVEYGHCT